MEIAAKYRDQRLFDAEMRLSILKVKLADALHERDGLRRRKVPTRMIETIIEIMQGDIVRMTRHLDELRGTIGEIHPAVPDIRTNRIQGPASD